MRGARLAVLLLPALLIACGGGSKTTATTSGTATSTGTTAQRPGGPGASGYHAAAERICHIALAETHALGERFKRSPGNGSSLQVITNGLVRPGIKIRERMAARMRRLAQSASDPRFTAYVDLFDPLDSIARERLRAGLTGQIARARDLERLMVDLGDEQKAAARLAGLPTCTKDFFVAALGAPSG